MGGEDSRRSESAAHLTQRAVKAHKEQVAYEAEKLEKRWEKHREAVRRPQVELFGAGGQAEAFSHRTSRLGEEEEEDEAQFVEESAHGEEDTKGDKKAKTTGKQ